MIWVKWMKWMIWGLQKKTHIASCGWYLKASLSYFFFREATFWKAPRLRGHRAFGVLLAQMVWGKLFFVIFFFQRSIRLARPGWSVGNKGLIDNYYGYHVRKTKRNLGGPKGFGWNKRNLGGLNEIGWSRKDHLSFRRANSLRGWNYFHIWGRGTKNNSKNHGASLRWLAWILWGN